MEKRLCFIISIVLFFCLPGALYAQSPGDKSYISPQNRGGYFPLSANGRCAALYTDTAEYAGVKIAAKSLQADITSVTASTPDLLNGNRGNLKQMVIIGTIDKSPLIDKLIKTKKFNVDSIKGKWEAHITQVVNNPLPGVKQALVIAGSDKRGTIYGIYGLSAQIGVSPWYWWADVPVKRQKNLYVIPGRYADGGPAVKYRGIFINDEAPSFSGWAKEKFGGINHKVYEKVFELILRLKGNYLWPAMWGNAFNDDDKLDP
ncbi:MAG: glycosyl hydrolase 115 family protein, partial [Candidatus Saccharimonadales bacterium]